MAKGYGIQINDWALLAAVVGAGYLAYKTIGKPISDVSGAITKPMTAASNEASDIINAAGELTTEVINSPSEYWNYWYTLGEDMGATVRGWFT